MPAMSLPPPLSISPWTLAPYILKAKSMLLRSLSLHCAASAPLLPTTTSVWFAIAPPISIARLSTGYQNQESLMTRRVGFAASWSAPDTPQ